MNRFWFRLLRILILNALFVMGVAACGGGGGGGNNDGTGGDGGGLGVVGTLDTGFGEDHDGDGTPDGWRVVVAPNAAGGDIFYPRDVVMDAAGRIVVAGYQYIGSSSTPPLRKMSVWRLDAAGNLDPTFGNDYDGDGERDGYYLADDAEATEGNAIALDGNRIVVAGFAEVGAITTKQVRIWRLTSSGQKDTTFPNSTAATGYFTIADPDSNGDGVSEGSAEALDVIVDDSGRILIAGYATRSDFSRQPAVWRLINFLGFWGLDSLAFGTNGVFLDPGSLSGNEEALALTEDASGNIVVTGYKQNVVGSATGLDMTVWRLTSDGKPDSAFGEDYDADGTLDGYFSHHNAAGGNGAEMGRFVVVNDDGRILVAGSSTNVALVSSDAVVWRLTAAGQLDTTFNGGYRTIAAPDNIIQVANHILLTSSGDIFVSGVKGFFSQSLLLWRLAGNGELVGESRFEFPGTLSSVLFNPVSFLDSGSSQLTVVVSRQVVGAPSMGTGIAILRYRL